MFTDAFGLIQPASWPDRRAEVPDEEVASDVRPLVGTHRITGDSAQAFIAMHDRRARMAAESLQKVLAYVPGNKRPGAPVGSRLVRVGARGADVTQITRQRRAES